MPRGSPVISTSMGHALPFAGRLSIAHVLVSLLLRSRQRCRAQCMWHERESESQSGMSQAAPWRTADRGTPLNVRHHWRPAPIRGGRTCHAGLPRHKPPLLAPVLEQMERCVSGTNATSRWGSCAHPAGRRSESSLPDRVPSHLEIERPVRPRFHLARLAISCTIVSSSSSAAHRARRGHRPTARDSERSGNQLAPSTRPDTANRHRNPLCFRRATVTRGPHRVSRKASRTPLSSCCASSARGTS